MLRNYFEANIFLGYYTISVTDSRGSRIQIYSDIDETWTGQTGKTAVQFQNSDSTSVFTLSVKNAAKYSQNSNDQALWGNVIFASRSASPSILTVNSGAASTVRGQFVNQGALLNANATSSATLNSVPWITGAVAGLSHDLGNVASKAISVTFEIGYVRQDAINYLGASYTGINAPLITNSSIPILTHFAGYYQATYSNTFSALSAFIDDYDDAQAESLLIDAKISSAAETTAGSNYSDIVTLSLRQAFGGIDLTIPTSTLDTDDVLGFIKEISRYLKH